MNSTPPARRLSGVILSICLAMSACGGVVDPSDQDAARPTDARTGLDASTDAGAADGASALDASTDAAADAGSDANVDSAAGRLYTIAFHAVVGVDDAHCGVTYAGFGPLADQQASIKDFRFYVHAIELIRADDSAVALTIAEESPWQRAGVALLDFEDKTGACANGTSATRTVVHGYAPSDTYVGIRFVLGVPFSLNHGDRSSAAPPLDLSPLFWSWQGGYIFSRLDLVTTPAPDGGLVSGFSVHLGSTGCDGSPASGGTTACAAPNRPTITLASFDPDSDVVVADAKALVSGVDLTVNTPGTAVGCMSSPVDPECDGIMPRFGLDFGSAMGTQVFFHVGSP